MTHNRTHSAKRIHLSCQQFVCIFGHKKTQHFQPNLYRCTAAHMKLQCMWIFSGFYFSLQNLYIWILILPDNLTLHHKKDVNRSKLDYGIQVVLLWSYVTLVRAAYCFFFPCTPGWLDFNRGKTHNGAFQVQLSQICHWILNSKSDKVRILKYAPLCVCDRILTGKVTTSHIWIWMRQEICPTLRQLKHTLETNVNDKVWKRHVEMEHFSSSNEWRNTCLHLYICSN